jgi:hypothetical protein
MAVLGFKQYLWEEAYQDFSEAFNRAQMKAISKLQSFETYIKPALLSKDKIFVRKDRHTFDYVMANSQQKHLMRISITKRGKIFRHRIEKQTSKGVWEIVKSVDEKGRVIYGSG